MLATESFFVLIQESCHGFATSDDASDVAYNRLLEPRCTEMMCVGCEIMDAAFRVLFISASVPGSLCLQLTLKMICLL